MEIDMSKTKKPAPKPRPRPTKGGYRYPGPLLALVALLMAVGCSAAQRTEAKTALIDCGKAGLEKVTGDLVPVVTTVLSDTDSDWRKLLYGLAEGAGRDAVACAVKVIARATEERPGVRALVTEPTVADKAAIYIGEQGWAFSLEPVEPAALPPPAGPERRAEYDPGDLL